MKNRRWLNLMLLGLLLFLPSICHAQWYQGPSGGRGGVPFDFWKASNENRDIEGVHVIVANGVIRCITLEYRGGSTYSSSPGCVLRRGEREGTFFLHGGEYLIGIAGRHGDLIDSIRIYTSLRDFRYGGSGGSADFGYTAPSGQKIVAFFGRAGDSLDAIGVMYAPVK